MTAKTSRVAGIIVTVCICFVSPTDGAKLTNTLSKGFSTQNAWRQAKLRGASFRATGHSPPWTLEIFDNDRIELTFLDSSRSTIFDFVNPSVNRDQRKIEYLVQKKLQLIIKRKACRNLKTGEFFQNAVSVHLPHIEVEGCGLHLKAP